MANDDATKHVELVNPLRAPAAFKEKAVKREDVYVFRKHKCRTDGMARERSPFEIVLDASEGFIPLWEKGIILRWRFQEASLAHLPDTERAKSAIRELMLQALQLWGGFRPVKFAERSDAWDFEIVVRENSDCDINGCVLASAFFPDAGRHELVIYPEMFDQDAGEQVQTMAHELGHVFGLRHFFAKVHEQAWPAEIFGEHVPFSIMNYGAQSELTAADKADLQRLYDAVWAGALTEINGTPIRQVRPYHLTGNALVAAAAAVSQA